MNNSGRDLLIFPDVSPHFLQSLRISPNKSPYSQILSSPSRTAGVHRDSPRWFHEGLFSVQRYVHIFSRQAACHAMDTNLSSACLLDIFTTHADRTSEPAVSRGSGTLFERSAFRRIRSGEAGSACLHQSARACRVTLIALWRKTRGMRLADSAVRNLKYNHRTTPGTGGISPTPIPSRSWRAVAEEPVWGIGAARSIDK